MRVLVLWCFLLLLLLLLLLFPAAGVSCCWRWCRREKHRISR
jgi:hypothetical protein